MGSAVGLIETKGLIGAIEALDACLKSANVTLINQELTDGGWVMISVTGDVGAVSAAVEAGSNAAERLGVLISAHVIPRLSDEVFEIVKEEKHTPEEVDVSKEVDAIEETKIFTEVKTEEYTKKEQISDEKNTLKAQVSNEIVSFKGKSYKIFGKTGIENLKVVQLRQIARQMDIKTIDRGLIKFANKEQLLNAIREHVKGGKND